MFLYFKMANFEQFFVLRYRDDSLKTMPPSETDGSVNPSCAVSSEPYVQHTARDVLRQIFNLDNVVTPTKFTSKLSVYMIVTIGKWT